MLPVKTSSPAKKRSVSSIVVATLVFAAIFWGGLGLIIIGRQPLGGVLASRLSWLFANNSTRATWYITRSAGWVAYILLWLSTVWGLALPAKLFDRFLSPTFTFDFHEYISLLSVGFILLHVAVLLFDQYLPYSLAQILFPFLSPYRPLWVGIGVISFYLILLVTITFYLRRRIGQKKFKSIHTLSLVAYIGSLFHAFFSGTDSSLGAAQWVYYSTFLVVVFLTVYWLVRARQIKFEKAENGSALDVRVTSAER